MTQAHHELAIPESPGHFAPNVLTAYIRGSYMTPQTISAQSIAMGVAVIGDILEGKTTWADFQEATLGDDQAVVVGKAMVAAHNAHGIRVGPTELSGDTSAFRADFAYGLSASRNNLTRMVARFVGVTMRDEGLRYSWHDVPSSEGLAEMQRVAQTALSPREDGTFHPAITGLKKLLDVMNNTLSPKNPEAAKIRDQIYADFSTLEGPLVRSGLRRIARRRAAERLQVSNQAYRDLVVAAIRAAVPAIDAAVGGEKLSYVMPTLMADSVMQGGIDLESRKGPRKMHGAINEEES